MSKKIFGGRTAKRKLSVQNLERRRLMAADVSHEFFSVGFADEISSNQHRAEIFSIANVSSPQAIGEGRGFVTAMGRSGFSQLPFGNGMLDGGFWKDNASTINLGGFNVRTIGSGEPNSQIFVAGTTEAQSADAGSLNVVELASLYAADNEVTQVNVTDESGSVLSAIVSLDDESGKVTRAGRVLSLVDAATTSVKSPKLVDGLFVGVGGKAESHTFVVGAHGVPVADFRAVTLDAGAVISNSVKVDANTFDTGATPEEIAESLGIPIGDNGTVTIDAVDAMTVGTQVEPRTFVAGTFAVAAHDNSFVTFEAGTVKSNSVKIDANTFDTDSTSKEIAEALGIPIGDNGSVTIETDNAITIGTDVESHTFVARAFAVAVDVDDISFATLNANTEISSSVKVDADAAPVEIAEALGIPIDDIKFVNNLGREVSRFSFELNTKRQGNDEGLSTILEAEASKTIDSMFGKSLGEWIAFQPEDSSLNHDLIFGNDADDSEPEWLPTGSIDREFWQKLVGESA